MSAQLDQGWEEAQRQDERERYYRLADKMRRIREEMGEEFYQELKADLWSAPVPEKPLPRRPF